MVVSVGHFVNPNAFFITMNLLKSFRERTGVLLQDMATMITIDTGSLSKMEHSKMELSVRVLLAYHLILKIPIERLCKYYYPEITKECLQGAYALEDQLVILSKNPKVKHRTQLVETIKERLEDLSNGYDEA